MALPLYLAMTGAEMTGSSPLPAQFAYLACRFSPYNQGLSGLPLWLPEGSLLILNDETPLCGHDPEQICLQLAQVLETWNCRGLLLDFERPGCEESAALAAFLCGALTQPVTVSEAYAGDLDCPVFLPPTPLDVPLKEYLAPWQTREIWLEAALDGLELALTESGCASASLPCPNVGAKEIYEPSLHCRYSITLKKDSARFCLRRARTDVEKLLQEAESLGVAAAVGLWQEFTGPSRSNVTERYPTV